MRGRRKPYTEIGITRVPCTRCSNPSEHQWQVCANGNRYVGVCKRCDLELNRMVLEFMGWSRRDVSEAITGYTRKYA